MSSSKDIQKKEQENGPFDKGKQKAANRVEIDSTLIPSLDIGQDEELRNLSDLDGILVGAKDQNTMESGIMAQVDQALKVKENAADRKRLQKVRGSERELRTKIDAIQRKLDDAATSLAGRNLLIDRLDSLDERMASFRQQEREILARMNERESDTAAGGYNETERERLIRTGKITPFAQVDDAEMQAMKVESSAADLQDGINTGETDVKMEIAPIGADVMDIEPDPEVPVPRRRLIRKRKRELNDDSEDEYVEDTTEILEEEPESVTESITDELNFEDEVDGKRKTRYEDKHVDDGDEAHYQNRLLKWVKTRRLRRLRHRHVDLETVEEKDLEKDIESEMFEASPEGNDFEYNSGYRMPGDIHSLLFDYQKTCTSWLWELHRQETGGIIGDEMGLGKTIQIIAFLAGLSFSRMLDKPVLVICPATILQQWVQEFHKWWAPFRVAILHSSGSGLAGRMPGGSDEDTDVTDEESDDTSPRRRNRRSKEHDNDEYQEDRRGNPRKGGVKKKQKTQKVSAQAGAMAKKAKVLVDRIVSKGHVIVTTFAGLRVHGKVLLPTEWSYCILDEGHKIRNPDAEITLACKQLRTAHRIILSGTPIQNNLTELWSLFDFVFPGRLGTLPVFQTQFSIPISLGGYANASNFQVQAAYKCACVLRDLIGPYLLRRMKVDVAADLPKKSEQVLFCKLTAKQRQIYKEFLEGSEVSSILEGKRHALFGIDILRKICNHPDLLERKQHGKDHTYGDVESSGKMKVVQALLRMWKRQRHKALVFCQTRQMQDILEKMIRAEGHRYQRMDGTTPIRNRIAMVDEFNNTPSIFVFLLTTKVGGLGVNLTGANRIIIFDPDWNPSTDMQARERAWRVGQTKDVTIYRLMTSGTIEEKIYHRQIFKQFLTNKILKDPRQRRFFKSNDMHELFILGQEDSEGTETADLFGADVEVPVGARSEKREKRRDKGKGKANDDSETEDLGTISGIAKMDEFRPPKEHEEAQEDSNAPPGDKEDGRILAALFSKNGVHSALQHDVIMEAATPEAILISQEATRVADAAIAALRQSRKAIRAQESQGGGVGVPTWTGRSGTAGAPRRFGNRPTAGSASPSVSSPITRPSTPTFGSGGTSVFRSVAVGSGSFLKAAPPSSTSLLANLYKRADAPSAPPPQSIDPNSQEGLIIKLRDYLAGCGGSATIEDVLTEFQLKLEKEDIPIFRNMLKGIATYEKMADGKRVWSLKSEFL